MVSSFVHIFGLCFQYYEHTHTHIITGIEDEQKLNLFNVLLIYIYIYAHKFVITHKSTKECNATPKLKTRSTCRNYL